MGRKAGDVVMNALAKGIDDLNFEDLDDSQNIAVEREREQGLMRIKLCHDHKTYVVSFYLGHAQRSLGFTKNIHTACRWHDVCVVHFWKYRIENPLYSEDDFNISQRLALDDHENPQIRAHLVKIEDHLIHCLALPDAESFVLLSKKRQQERREDKRTVRYEYVQMHGETQQMVEGNQRTIEEAMNQIKQQVLAQATMSGKLDKLVSKVDHLFWSSDCSSQRVLDGETGREFIEIFATLKEAVLKEGAPSPAMVDALARAEHRVLGLAEFFCRRTIKYPAGELRERLGESADSRCDVSSTGLNSARSGCFERGEKPSHVILEAKERQEPAILAESLAATIRPEAESLAATIRPDPATARLHAVDCFDSPVAESCQGANLPVDETRHEQK